MSTSVGTNSYMKLLRDKQGPGGHPAHCAPSWRQSAALPLPHHHMPGSERVTGGLTYSDLVFVFSSLSLLVYYWTKLI